MSPARAKRGQENDKRCWALRRLPKPALAPHANPPRRAQPTPKSAPDRNRIGVTSPLSPPPEGGEYTPKRVPAAPIQRWTGALPHLAPPSKGKGTASPDLTRTRRQAHSTRSQMGVIRPARSPHPGSQTCRECTIAQKCAFVCRNLTKVGTVSSDDRGLACS